MKKYRALYFHFYLLLQDFHWPGKVEFYRKNWNIEGQAKEGVIQHKFQSYFTGVVVWWLVFEIKIGYKTYE